MFSYLAEHYQQVRLYPKGQLISKWISQISALLSNKLPEQKYEKFLVGILGETMTS